MVWSCGQCNYELEENRFFLRRLAANSSGDAFIGRKTKKRLSTGSTIKVVIAKVDRFKRLMDFAMV